MIRRVCWKQDSSLSGLELDFTKPDGSIYNTIVFVGENGAGKTRILDSLSDFLNCKNSFEFESFEYEIAGDKFCLYPNPSGAYPYQHNRFKNDEMQSQHFWWKNNGYAKLMEDAEDIRSYGCAFSRARTGFKTEPIDKSTNKVLDGECHMSDDNFDYTDVKQTLIDVEYQDNTELKILCKNLRDNGQVSSFDQEYSRFCERSRISRFSNAFNDFFDGLMFKGVKLTDAENQVLFEKSGKEVNIDNLSTGEKQIVFRGSYLLRNSHNLKDGVILIDEPELSMHPKWQSKILDFYRNLLTYDGVQTAQMFIATHSDYVLKSALKDQENVLVVLLQVKDGRTVVGPIEKRVLPEIDSAEIDYLIFGMSTYEYHIRLFCYYKELSQCEYISNVDEVIHKSDLYDSGLDRIGRKGKMESLPVYVRNSIDHPGEHGRKVDEPLLKQSIELLRELIQTHPKDTNPGGCDGI